VLRLKDPKPAWAKQVEGPAAASRGARNSRPLLRTRRI